MKKLQMRENQTIIGVLNPYYNKEKLENLAKKNKSFSLEMLQELLELNQWISCLRKQILPVIKQ